jgi:hypothetical protein
MGCELAGGAASNAAAAIAIGERRDFIEATTTPSAKPR